MKTKNLAIICICIIAVIAVGAVAIAMPTTAEETNLQVLSNSSLNSQDNFTVKLTADKNPIANQTINITAKDSNGNQYNQQITTNDEGIASLSLNGLASGNYTIECDYIGTDGYKPSNLTTSLEIKEVVTNDVSTSTSSSSSDSDDDPYGGAYIDPSEAKSQDDLDYINFHNDLMKRRQQAADEGPMDQAAYDKYGL